MLSPPLGGVSVLDFGHSNRCVVVSHYCLSFHFPDETCKMYFHIFICPLCIFCGEVCVKAFDPLLNWVVCDPFFR